jgi:hypothetical protein
MNPHPYVLVWHDEYHKDLPRCPDHGCPGCFTSHYDAGECRACDDAVLCRRHPDHLGMRRCPMHGCPGCFTHDKGPGSCDNCDELLRFHAICPYTDHHDTPRCPDHGCAWCFTAGYGSGECETCDEALRCRRHPDHRDMRRCPMHGCPGCFTHDMGPGSCDNCDELLRFHAICRYPGHKDMQRCSEHGCPGCFTDDFGCGECEDCDEQICLQYDRDWPETVVDPATGHDGEGCIHCTVCGRCRGTGTVCRWCERCTEHQDEVGADCERLRWDRFLRAERTYWEHSVFDKATGRWSP